MQIKTYLKKVSYFIFLLEYPIMDKGTRRGERRRDTGGGSSEAAESRDARPRDIAIVM